MTRRISKFGWLCGLMFLGSAAFAQTTPDTSVAAALNTLGTRSGVVFAGEVTAIRHTGGVVEVEFQVDQNLKGAATGSYVLREWAGLWVAGQRRYWVGERAVVFLQEPGKGGLSSPVDGMEGILPLSPAGDASTGLSVDVQRLRTRVLRAAGAPMDGSATPMSLAAVALAVQPPPVGAPSPIEPPTPEPLPIRPLPTHKVPTVWANPQPDEPQQILQGSQTRTPESFDATH
jgi:hypothetical protein